MTRHSAITNAAPRRLVELEQRQLRRPAECPVETWLDFLGHRWNALILWHLQDGPKRNGELAARLPGVSPKVLAERLDGLESRQLVSRSTTATFPRAVVYELTPSGAELVAILDQVELWSRRQSGR